MITTALPFLTEVSELLNEDTVDTSAQRIGYFWRAARKLLSMFKWGWAKKRHTLSLTAGISEYDLTTEITDYNPSWGVYEVFADSIKIDPYYYENNSIYPTASQQFTLSPDNKTIKFSKPISGSEVIYIWYSPMIIRPTNSGSTLNIAFSDDALTAIVSHIKASVHEGKRQRVDARNALLEFQQHVDELRLQEASNKGRNFPKTVPNIFSISKFKRRYP